MKSSIGFETFQQRYDVPPPPRGIPLKPLCLDRGPRNKPLPRGGACCTTAGTEASWLLEDAAAAFQTMGLRVIPRLAVAGCVDGGA